MKRAIWASLAATVLSLSLAAGAGAITPVQTGQFGSSGSGSGQFTKPTGVAVDPTSGDVYVADAKNNRIDRFDAEGNFLLAWGWGVGDGSAEPQACTTSCQAGLPGGGEGQLNEPISVAVDPASGDVYTANYADGRIQKFEPSGAFVLQFGGFEAGNPEKFTNPLSYGNDVAVDSAGRVYVSNGYAVTPRVAVFSSSGAFEKSITSESGPGQLFNGSSIALDSADNLYVVDPFANQVEVFDASGAFVRKQAGAVGAQGVTINPADDHAFVLGVAGESTYTLYEYDPSGKLVGSTPVPGLAATVEGFVSYGIAFSGAAAASFPGRLPGAIYAADLNANQVLILTAAEPTAPAVEKVSASSVGSGAVDLEGTVTPNGAATKYTFEYGTTTAYGSKSPVAPGLEVGDGFDPVAVGTHLAGLAPGTTYHYQLVAENSLGTTPSGDRTFTTFPLGGGPVALPDGRAYELVSPLDKNLNDVSEAIGLSSSDGNGVAFSSFNGLPQSQTGALLGSYVARRGAGGWTTVPASPPDTNKATLLVGQPLLFSQDLSQDLVKSTNDLTGAAPANASGNLFLRTNATASHQLVTTETPTPDESGITYTALGASKDFKHIVFQANGKLTADAPELGLSVNQIYEWDGGALKLGSVLPGEVPAPGGGEGVAVFGIPKTGAVSDDGSRFYFTSPADFTAPGQLYMRANGTETIEVSASERAEADPLGPQAAAFQGAASDGSSVFFTSSAELTEDANTGEDTGANLYRYDTAAGTLTDLTVDTEATDLAGADVRGVLIAGDGNSAYFGATGVLATGATAGANNLYRWSKAGGVEFVAAIGEDPFMTTNADLNATAWVTDDGGVLVFTSTAALAGTEELNAAGKVAPEIYRYVAGGGLGCVSCAGRGTPVKGAVLTAPAYPGGGANAVSSDGSRVFFETKDALLAADVNGKGDVYEWEGGEVHLISSGAGAYDAILLDPSPSGNDVFFTTRDRLVASDSDDNVDVYDARAGGGFAVTEPPPPCAGEACRPPSASPPPTPALGSKGFNGPGSVKAKHKKKQQHKAKCKRGKKCSKSKRHPAGKRG